MGFFLGIDGGGSKTECVLADEAGTILARAMGGGANLGRVSPDQLRATVSSCVERLREAIGLPVIIADAVCAGLAGISRPRAREFAESVLTTLLRPHRLYLVGDMEIALEAAVGSGPGVVLVAGTGSIAYGRGADGRTARAGGLGAEAGDEGSGYDIGRRALEAALAASGVGRPSQLAEVFQKRLGPEAQVQLSTLLEAGDPASLAVLVTVVARAAQAGDADARTILEQAADALAGLALEVLAALNLLDTEVRVATCGGVFAASEQVLVGVRDRILARAPRAIVEPLDVAPAEGAVHMAVRLWLEDHAHAAKP